MRSRQRGFTLLEVLIALALFGIMLGLIFGALRMAGRTWEAGEARAEAVAGRMVLERFLRRVLGSARLWPGPVQTRDAGLVGGAGELSFNAYLPHTAGVAGLQRFTLYLAPAHPRGQDLKVRVTPLDGEIPDGEEELRDLVLLEQVETVRFAYWRDGNDGEGEWVDHWEDQSLPRAVQVEVERKTEAWPPVVVRLTVQGGGPGGGNPFRQGVFGQRLF